MRLTSALKAREVDLVLLLVAFFWGSSYLAVKTLTEHASVTVVLSLRFILTSLGMLAIWIYKRESWGRNELLLGAALGTTQALILFCETEGVSRTKATNAGLIISLAIVLTPILESIASKNWLPRKFFIATVAAVVGVLLLVSNKGFSAPNLGDWFMLVAAIIRGFHVTAMGHMTKDKNYSSINITLVQSLICAFWYILFAGNDVVDTARGLESQQWWGLIYVAGLCGVFSFLATLWAIRRTSASRASLLLGTEPVWAVVIGVSIGGETLALVGLLGAITIITATTIGQRIESEFRQRVS